MLILRFVASSGGRGGRGGGGGRTTIWHHYGLPDNMPDFARVFSGLSNALMRSGQIKRVAMNAVRNGTK